MPVNQIRIGIVGFACLLGAAPFAAAQTPTKEQVAAIRQSCRADYMRECRDVTPGGKDALLCLASHRETLSPPCRAAVAAAVPGP